MAKRVMKNLLCIGVALVLASVFATEAAAVTCSTSKTLTTQTCCSWKTTSSGVKYCSLWCTGSEVCVNTINGLSGSIMKDCQQSTATTQGTCPVTDCSVYGTVQLDTTDLELGDCALPGVLNPTCGIAGMAVCTNPNEHFNWNGTPYTLPGVEQAVSGFLFCDKKGKCTNLLELEPQYTSEICVNPNWHFETFTASEFKGKACFCPGGYVGSKCCADSTRTDGGCIAYGDGTPICLISLCTIDLSTYDPFTNSDLPYSCGEPFECGGITGTKCP